MAGADRRDRDILGETVVPSRHGSAPSGGGAGGGGGAPYYGHAGGGAGGSRLAHDGGRRDVIAGGGFGDDHGGGAGAVGWGGFGHPPDPSSLDRSASEGSRWRRSAAPSDAAMRDAGARKHAAFLEALRAQGPDGESQATQRLMSDEYYGAIPKAWWPSREAPVHVALGADVDARSWHFISTGGIAGGGSAARPHFGLVVNAAGQMNAPNYFSSHPDIDYVDKDLMDEVGQEVTSADLHEFADAINDAFAAGRNVFVHCLEGKSRSAMAFIAFLGKHQHMDYDAALRFLQAQRRLDRFAPQPNPTFERATRAFITECRIAAERGAGAGAAAAAAAAAATTAGGAARTRDVVVVGGGGGSVGGTVDARASSSAAAESVDDLNAELMSDLQRGGGGAGRAGAGGGYAVPARASSDGAAGAGATAAAAAEAERRRAGPLHRSASSAESGGGGHRVDASASLSSSADSPVAAAPAPAGGGAGGADAAADLRRTLQLHVAPLFDTEEEAAFAAGALYELEDYLRPPRLSEAERKDVEDNFFPLPLAEVVPGESPRVVVGSVHDSARWEVVKTGSRGLAGRLEGTMAQPHFGTILIADAPDSRDAPFFFHENRNVRYLRGEAYDVSADAKVDEGKLDAIADVVDRELRGRNRPQEGQTRVGPTNVLLVSLRGSSAACIAAVAWAAKYRGIDAATTMQTLTEQRCLVQIEPRHATRVHAYAKARAEAFLRDYEAGGASPPTRAARPAPAAPPAPAAAAGEAHAHVHGRAVTSPLPRREARLPGVAVGVLGSSVDGLRREGAAAAATLAEDQRRRIELERERERARRGGAR
mmetsp:Transcript_16270/g.56841  ORF Transcript_16270/g.56841 Transcript_16270/m.56841 type:complete len:823 (-) Transcript_16270:2210-4678(-)